MRVTLNLNAMHGRSGHHLPGYGCCGTANASEVGFPPWNCTQSEALLRWTVAHIPEQQWPAWLGLGNEKTGLIPTPQYVADLATLRAMLDRVFPKGTAPQTYAPCGCSKDLASPGLNSVGFLEAVAAAEAAAGTPLLGAFSWHSYPQLCKQSSPAVEAADLRGGTGVLMTQRYYNNMAATLQAHPPGRALSWITESAYSCGGPANASKGGAAAAVDGMLRAVDMPWYIDALGAASASGVHVFCKETLVGDWLETIRSWQGASGAMDYGPHADFWVAALWAKLMGQKVLAVTVKPQQQSDLPLAPRPGRDAEVIMPAPSVVLRAYAHCGRTSGSVVIAMTNVGNSSAPLVVSLSAVSLSDIAEAAPSSSAAAATQWVLSGASAAADGALLNGKPLAVTVTDERVSIPSLEGSEVVGGSVSLPLGAVAFVEIQTTAPACAHDERRSS